MVGLDQSGKTTILYQLKLGGFVYTSPTIGFNVEKVKANNASLLIWDVGGSDKIRVLWKHYFRNNNGLIFVINTGDYYRFEEARKELYKILDSEEMDGVPLLILANKSDLANTKSIDQIIEAFDLYGIPGRNWIVYKTNAIKHEGIVEGLEWLLKNM